MSVIKAIERRLVNGAWRTGLVDEQEGNGGSQPDFPLVVPLTLAELNAATTEGTLVLELAELEAGDWYLGGMIEITEDFDDSANDVFRLAASTTADPTDGRELEANGVSYAGTLNTSTRGIIGATDWDTAIWANTGRAIQFAVAQTGKTVKIYITGVFNGDGETGAAVARLLIVRAS